MKNHHRLAAAAAAAAILLTGAGCGSDDSAESAPAASADTSKINAEAAADAAEAFFNEATSDEIAAAFPDKYNETTFAAAAEKTDPEAPKDKSTEAITDIAWLKVENPKAKLEIKVDAGKVNVEDRKATVPAEAVKITSDGKDVANNAELAAHIGNLVYTDEWLIAFPEEKAPAKDEAEEKATPSASPSAEAKK